MAAILISYLDKCLHRGKVRTANMWLKLTYLLFNSYKIINRLSEVECKIVNDFAFGYCEIRIEIYPLGTGLIYMVSNVLFCILLVLTDKLLMILICPPVRSSSSFIRPHLRRNWYSVHFTLADEATGCACWWRADCFRSRVASWGEIFRQFMASYMLCNLSYLHQ